MGGVALMAKHDKMNEVNRQESERRIKEGKPEIEKTLEKTRLAYLELL